MQYLKWIICFIGMLFLSYLPINAADKIDTIHCFTKYSTASLYSYKHIRINKKINQSKIALVDSIFNLFKPKYPDLSFYFINEDNIRAFISNECIYISAGLVNSKYINTESIILILAHEVGHVYDSVCNNPRIVNCNTICIKCASDFCSHHEQVADFSATRLILPTVFSTDVTAKIIQKGVPAIIEFISKEKGYTEAGYHKDVACRDSTFKAGSEKNIPIPKCKNDNCK